MGLFSKKKPDIFKAAAAGDVETITAWLKKPGDIDAADKDGITAVSHAARNGQVRVLKMLLAKKPNLEIADEKGNTALLAASAAGQTEACLALVAAGANFEAHERGTYVRTLSKAAFQGDVKLIRSLIAAGADLNAIIASNGRTALHWAADKQFSECVEILMRAGARADIANNEGKTAFDLAAEKKPQHILKLMEKIRDEMKAAPKPELKKAPVEPAVPEPKPAEPESWSLVGTTGVAHAAVAPELGRRITEIFNFASRERRILVENLKTGAETVGQAEKFDTIDEAAVQAAEERLKALGGTLPPSSKKSFSL